MAPVLDSVDAVSCTCEKVLSEMTSEPITGEHYNILEVPTVNGLRRFRNRCATFFLSPPSRQKRTVFNSAAVSSRFLGAHRRQPAPSECDGRGAPCPGHTVPPHASQRASQQADRRRRRRLWHHSSQTRYFPINGSSS